MLVPRDVLHGALRLAVTELHHAYHEASVASHQATPGVIGVHWRLSNTHVVPDICDELAARGPYRPDQVPVKTHPWCRCFTVPAMEPVVQFAECLRAWANAPMSQPDIEEWYQRYREFLEPVHRFRGLQVPGAADGQERFWADRAYQGHLLADLYRALQSGDKAATRAAIQPIDNAVVYALERAGLPRGQVTDVIVASPAEEPSLEGAAGEKRPDCRIMINSFRVKRAIEGLIDLDDVLRT